jgi:hypothetical protein
VADAMIKAELILDDDTFFLAKNGTSMNVSTHVQGVRLNHANFASEEVICSRLE